MKTKLIVIAAVLFAAAGIAFAAEYHYGFILSCGQEAYYTSTRPLTEDELAERTEFYENTICRQNQKTTDATEDMAKDKNRP